MSNPKLYGNRWKILQSLPARGGQADVFLAQDVLGEYESPVVLKRVRNPKRHDRFKAEVETTKILRHPNIITLLDHSALADGSEAEEKQFIVMPYAKNGDLSNRVALYTGNIDSIIQVGRQIADALRCAHENPVQIIHRDVKPQNVLFAGDNHEVLLGDFGICLIRDAERATDTSEVVGPVQFMAPELEAGGQLQVTPAVDVYSLGKVIYFMFTGGTIVPRERIHEPTYSAVFDQSNERARLLQTLLSKMICPLDRRFGSMRDVIGELDRISAWAKDARISPISSSSLAKLEGMQRRALEDKQNIEQNQDKRRRREIEFASAQRGAIDWIGAELAKAAEQIRMPGAIACDVQQVEGDDNEPVLSDRRGFLAVDLRFMNELAMFRQQHILRFKVYSPFSTQVRIFVCQQDPRRHAQLEEAEHTDVEIIPLYGQSMFGQQKAAQVNWHSFVATGGLHALKDHRVRQLPGHGRYPGTTPVAAPSALALSFSSEAWPSVVDQFQQFVSTIVDRFIATVERSS